MHFMGPFYTVQQPTEIQSDNVEGHSSTNVDVTVQGSSVDATEGEIETVHTENSVEVVEQPTENVDTVGVDVNVNVTAEVKTQDVDNAVRKENDETIEEASGEAAGSDGVETGGEDSQGLATEGLSEKFESKLSLRDEEMNVVGAEILFPRTGSQLGFGGWDNLRWMSYAGARKIKHCLRVEKLLVSDKKGLNLFGFGTASTDEYVPRKLVVYDDPSLILLLRTPNGPGELRELLDLPEGAELNEKEHSLNSFLVVDASAEPMSCKLRLSPLTTPTSVTEEDMDTSDPRRMSCFYLMTPMETIALSAIVGGQAGVSYTDSSAFLETTTAELAMGKALCQGHEDEAGLDKSWKHQIVLGTLHSYVVLGSQKLLEKAIMAAMKRSKENVTPHGTKGYLHARLVDRVDDCGLTPLHYACFRRFNIAVALLVNAGARVDIRTDHLDMAPLHMCAMNLDHKSLSIILSANFPVKPNPNLLDSLGRTPMYIAAVDGLGPGLQRDPASLGRCIMALEAWGGQMLLNPGNSTLRWPHSVLATQWRPDDLSEVLRHSAFRFPLQGQLFNQHSGTSIGAFYHYPLHSSLICLVREVQSFYDNDEFVSLGPFGETSDNSVAR